MFVGTTWIVNRNFDWRTIWVGFLNMAKDRVGNMDVLGFGVHRKRPPCSLDTADLRCWRDSMGVAWEVEKRVLHAIALVGAYVVEYVGNSRHSLLAAARFVSRTLAVPNSARMSIEESCKA